MDLNRESWMQMMSLKDRKTRAESVKKERRCSNLAIEIFFTTVLYKCAIGSNI